MFIYSETGIQPAINEASQTNGSSEFYLINVHSRQYDELGTLDTTINSTHIKHRPSDNSIQVDEPLINLYDQGLAQWKISAQRGVIYDEGDKIDLTQRVVIISNDQITSLKTPQLFIYPNKKLVNTEQAVTLHSANGFTRAVGMRANLAEKTIVLLDKVRGQYEPKGSTP